MMKTLTFTTTVTVCGYDELTDADRALVDAAREATSRSYSPYSHFAVGAALRLANGETVTGSNQENVAYPSGTCAERTTAFYASARYPGVAFDTLAIAAVGTDGRFTEPPTAPCGACRQALLEYETRAGHPLRVILAGRDTIYTAPSIRSLMPLAFTEF